MRARERHGRNDQRAPERRRAMRLQPCFVQAPAARGGVLWALAGINENVTDHIRWQRHECDLFEHN